MQVDLATVRRRERRDGIPCFTLREPAPSNVAHLIHPNHPDYDAARRLFDEVIAPAKALPAPVADQFWTDRHSPEPT